MKFPTESEPSPKETQQKLPQVCSFDSLVTMDTQSPFQVEDHVVSSKREEDSESQCSGEKQKKKRVSIDKKQKQLFL